MELRVTGTKSLKIVKKKLHDKDKGKIPESSKSLI